MKNFKLLIEYDGTHFHGWQRQATDRTVQGEIELALATMLGTPVTLNGSGRTDAGVHALGQVANFRCHTHLTPNVLLKGLNSLLPADVTITHCQPAPEAFHARYDAKGKHYTYWILNREIRPALGRHYVWFIKRPLLLEPMRQAAACFIGRHDFKAFEAAGSPRSSTVRTVRRAQLCATPNGFVRFDIEADGFLRYMVRNIVGMLVAAGSGKFSPEALQTVFASRDRRLAAPTAPAQGLFLRKVIY